MERQYDRHSIVETSGQRLDTDTKNIDANPHMRPEQKSAEKGIARAHYRQEYGRFTHQYFEGLVISFIPLLWYTKSVSQPNRRKIIFSGLCYTVACVLVRKIALI